MLLAHQPQPPPPAGEDVTDERLEVLRGGREGLLEALRDLAIGVADQHAQLTQRRLEVGALGLQLLDALERVAVLLGGEAIPAAESDAAEESAEREAAAAEAAADGFGPDELLGVEIEVTPAGKSMKRLSVLSGGEKSMTAIAFLFAVFLARPCPFYILDEVEAALDDLNIDRFLTLLRRHSERAQFIVVTHQKRTMEAADWLYGVSMGDDGTSKVVSRRLGRDGLVEVDANAA